MSLMLDSDMHSPIMQRKPHGQLKLDSGVVISEYYGDNDLLRKLQLEDVCHRSVLFDSIEC
jgi:hypothetical protein